MAALRCALLVAACVGVALAAKPHATFSLWRAPHVRGAAAAHRGDGVAARAGPFWRSHPTAARVAAGLGSAGVHPYPMSGGTGMASGAAFWMNLTVGSPGVTFAVQVDTGSSNTLVPTVGCDTCGGPSVSPRRYSPAQSNTSRALACSSAMCQNCVAPQVGTAVLPSYNQPCKYRGQCVGAGTCEMQVSYGGGSLSALGHVHQDRACLVGGGPAGAPTVCGKPEYTYIGAMFSQDPPESLPNGILGLAFPDNACTPTCQPTFLDSLVASGAIAPEMNRFGMCVTDSRGGILDLGGVDGTRVIGGEAAIQYAKVTHKHWYNIDVVSLQFAGGRTVPVPSLYWGVTNDVIGSFVDSGTMPLLMGPAIFQHFAAAFLADYAHLPGVSQLFQSGGMFASGCANLTAAQVAAYPTLQFNVRGQSGDATFPVEVESRDYLQPQPGGSPDTVCLQVAGVPSLGVIMGDVVMNRYYMVFDRVNARLGFGKLNPGSCR